MNQHNGFVLITVLTFVVCCSPSGSSAAEPPDTWTIAIGDSLAQAKAKLHAAGVTFGNGGFSFAWVEDQGNLFCIIDEESTMAAIFYSQRRQVVTRLSLVFFPPGAHSKSNETWMTAKSLRFDSDGGYHVHFAAPTKPSAKGLPKSKVPAATPKR